MSFSGTWLERTQELLNEKDPKLAGWISKERVRQEDGLEMIASENYVSPTVLAAAGTWLTNKYAEGYPGKRYYGGCEVVDEVEALAIERATKLFQSKFANVQPHSGSQANMAVYLSELKAGDKILGMDLSHGGHLTHGSPVNFSGLLFQVEHYGVDEKTHRLDYDKIRDHAKRFKPQMIVAGASAYPRLIDFETFKSIARDVGACLMVDMAHIAGLVATGLHPSPVPHADYVTTTTHKTLRGPRSGLILTNDEERSKKVNKRIFPGIQGGPLLHIIAAKAVAFEEALQPNFKKYCQQVISNCQALAKVLMKNGLTLVSGGTENHLLLVDLRPLALTGKDMENRLGEAGITVNKNTIPYDTQSPFVTSGLRIGTPALTTRGMGVSEMEQIGGWISQILKDPKNDSLVTTIRKNISDLCKKFPVYRV